MNQELIDREAMEIASWIQDAVGDMAYDMDPDDLAMCYGKRWGTKAQYENKGWLADEMYSDPDILQDLCGDRIFDAATRLAKTGRDPANSTYFIAIAESMKRNAHKALIIALDALIDRRKACLKKSQ
jgi:hypothetical protein